MSENRSLKEEFEHANKLAGSLSSLPYRPDAPEYQAAVAECLKSFNKCKEYIYKLSLFSDNEGSDDISTADIKYLSVNFFLGKVTEKSQRLSRIDTIKHAIDFYFQYLKSLRNYGLLNSVLPKRVLDSISSGKLTLRDIKASNPTTIRAEKIERFQKEKELKAKISAMTEHTDEEVVRDLEFKRLELIAVEAINSLDMLNSELELVSRFPVPPPSISSEQNGQRDDDRIKSRDGSDNGWTDRVEQRLTNKTVPLLSKDGKVNRPFTIVATKRDQLKQQVMGTGQSLPTMSVEEYLEEEVKRGGIIEGGGPSSKDDESSDEDDEEEQDRKTYKSRQWDEFVEANPKGSGNTMNRG